FMTDWQQPLVVAMTQAEGLSIIHETVYENRFGFTDPLRSMGANIQLYRECLGGTPCRFGRRNYLHSAVVAGPTALKGTRIDVPDLRGGFSHLIAALAAQGTSEVQHRTDQPRLRELPRQALRPRRRGVRMSAVTEPDASDRELVAFDPGAVRSQNRAGTVAATAAYGLMRTATRMSVHGVEHLPPKGTGFIIAAYHANHLDPILVGLALKRNGRMP